MILAQTQNKDYFVRVVLSIFAFLQIFLCVDSDSEVLPTYLSLCIIRDGYKKLTT
jgi:hypothetical protein